MFCCECCMQPTFYNPCVECPDQCLATTCIFVQPLSEIPPIDFNLPCCSCCPKPTDPLCRQCAIPDCRLARCPMPPQLKCWTSADRAFRTPCRLCLPCCSCCPVANEPPCRQCTVLDCSLRGCWPCLPWLSGHPICRGNMARLFTGEICISTPVLNPGHIYLTKYVQWQNELNWLKENEHQSCSLAAFPPPERPELTQSDDLRESNFIASSFLVSWPLFDHILLD